MRIRSKIKNRVSIKKKTLFCLLTFCLSALTVTGQDILSCDLSGYEFREGLTATVDKEFLTKD